MDLYVDLVVSKFIARTVAIARTRPQAQNYTDVKCSSYTSELPQNCLNSN